MKDTEAKSRFAQIKEMVQKKNVLFGVLALILVLAIAAAIVIPMQQRANTYRQIISALCVEDGICPDSFSEVWKRIDDLPEAYRDTAQLREYVSALERYEEGERSSAEPTLLALEEVGPFTDPAMAEQYAYTVSYLTREKQQYQADLAAAEKVTAAISALPNHEELTLSHQEQVETARRLYETCTRAVQDLVCGLERLTKAEERLEQLATYQEEGARVAEEIAAIGTVTLEQKEKIDQIQAAYDALPEEAKEFVSNGETLEAAQTQLKLLQSAQAVSNQIDQIGTVTQNSKATLEQVQAAYDALPAGAKEYVKNSGKLKQAQNQFASLQKSSGRATSPSTSAGKTYYWTPSGKVYHTTLSCPTLSRSKNIQSGAAPSGRRVCKVCS